MAAVLAPDASNFFIHTASGASEAFTRIPNPTPQLLGIKKQLVTYQRPDGVGLSMTLYLPPDYQPGERRPAVMWAYPYGVLWSTPAPPWPRKWPARPIISP